MKVPHGECQLHLSYADRGDLKTQSVAKVATLILRDIRFSVRKERLLKSLEQWINIDPSVG
jgi:hypothetical protein